LKPTVNARKKVAVMFGGRSAEHEISIITALQAISAMDTLCYEIIPLYINPSGKWYTGNALLEKSFYRSMPDNLGTVQQVTLLPDPTIRGLIPISPKGVMQLDKAIPVDVYFLTFHGQYGEDGCIQGLLELADVVYASCHVLSSALAMNKYLCKAVLEKHGISVLPATMISRKAAISNLAEVQRQILETPGLDQFPLFVKPSHLGSSIGISIAHDKETLSAALAKVFRYDDEAIIEPCITQLMEINVSVLDGDPPQASVVEVPIASEQALTYEDKYMRNGKTSGTQGMASLTRLIDPQDLDPAIKQKVRQDALKAFQILGCSGVGRFDFIFDLSNGKLYFNELNPIPGSLSFYLWEKSHPPILYTEIIHRLISKAQEHKSCRLALQKGMGFKALK
jgi:D-alanine-D-alanine ligase